MPSPFFNGLGDTILNTFKDGTTATFTPQVGSPQAIEVIFNLRHQEIDIDGKPYGAERPVAWIKTGIIVPKFDDEIKINGIDYLIKETKSDGLEITELQLVEKI